MVICNKSLVLEWLIGNIYPYVWIIRLTLENLQSPLAENGIDVKYQVLYILSN